MLAFQAKNLEALRGCQLFQFVPEDVCLAVRRKYLQKTLSRLFAVPQIAQRTSDGAINNAPQLLQNLLLDLLDDPQCEQ